MLPKSVRNVCADLFAGPSLSAALFIAAILTATGLLLSAALTPPSAKKSDGIAMTRRAEERVAVKLTRNENLAALLKRFGLPSGSAQELLRSLYSAVDLRQLPTGHAVNVILDSHDHNVRGVEFMFQDQIVRANATLGGWSVDRQELLYTEQLDAQRIKIRDTLASSAVRSRVSPALIAQLEKLFTSDIDLATDLASGDEVIMVVPKKVFIDGRMVTGPMVAARVITSGRSYDAYAFAGRYYDPDGNALPRAFLAAPLKYDRISSTFDLARPDPVTGASRPHEAIDYQAGHGTPVVTIGPGSVEFAGWRPGYGQIIEIKHANGYSSAYAHLSKITDGIREGTRVQSGEIIGEVGATGYATGPHLHFEFALNGERIDFLSANFPSPDSLTGAQLQRFQQEQLRWQTALRASNRQYAFATNGVRGN